MKSWGWSSHDGISALIRHPRGLSAPLPCKDTARRRPSMSQEVCPHQTQNLLEPWSWTSNLPNCEKWVSVVKLPSPCYFIIIANVIWFSALFFALNVPSAWNFATPNPTCRIINYLLRLIQKVLPFCTPTELGIYSYYRTDPNSTWLFSQLIIGDSYLSAC